MRAISIGFLVVGSALVASSAFAQEAAPAAPAKSEAPADLAELLEPIREKHELPAMGGAIVVGDAVTAIGATGLRQKGKKERVTVDDLWHLGSCTKAMTATLIARLVEKGELSWDTTIEAAFPKLKKIDDGFRPVTLELLLGNRGGAPADLSADGLWAKLQQRKGSHRAQRRTLVEAVLAKPPASDPGTTNLYSNAGFAIAGAAAEVSQDAAWEDLLREHVFEPLGMKSGGFGPPGSKKKVDQPRGHMPTGYAVVPGPLADNPPAIGPAGTVHATLRDWAKFVSAHLTGAKSDGSFLRPETFEKLHTALDGQTYALGWVTAKRGWGGGPVLWHNGSNTMWYCVTWIAPEKDFAVLVTSNQGGPKAREAADEAIGALIQRHLRPDDESK
jgi:CubicO group peptidase (beta-lactamase class C family)